MNKPGFLFILLVIFPFFSPTATFADPLVVFFEACEKTMLHFSLKRDLLKRRAWGIFGGDEARARTTAREILRAHGGDAGTSLFLNLNFPEAFETGTEGTGFNLDTYFKAIRNNPERVYSLKSWPLSLFNNPVFRKRFLINHGTDPEEILKDWSAMPNLQTIPSIFDRLTRDSETSRDPKALVELEKKLTANIPDRQKRALVTLIRELHHYRERMLKDYKLSRKGHATWNVDFGFPPPRGLGIRRPNGEILPDFYPGDILQLSAPFGEVTIRRRIGSGGEHVIYSVEEPNGKEHILKIGGDEFSKEFDSTEVDKMGLPVFPVKKVGPRYYLTERMYSTAETTISDALAGRDAEKDLAKILEVYGLYRGSYACIGDLKLSNLGKDGRGKFKISDWYPVERDGRTSDERFSGALGNKKLDLSMNLSLSFYALYQREIESRRGAQPDAAWMERYRKLIHRFNHELGLTQESMKGKGILGYYYNDYRLSLSDLEATLVPAKNIKSEHPQPTAPKK